jgi:hypothetical protein
MHHPQTPTKGNQTPASINLDLKDIDLSKVASIEGSALALILTELTECSEEQSHSLHSRHSSHSAHSAHPTFTWLHRGDNL